jgi:hypothetical protein
LTHIHDLFSEYDLYGDKNIPIVEKALGFVKEGDATNYYRSSFAFFYLGYMAYKKEAQDEKCGRYA